MKLLSTLNDNLYDIVFELSSRAAMLSGGNIISGENFIQQLSTDVLSAALLSVPTFCDIAADGTTLSSILSSTGADVSALDRKIDDVIAELEDVSDDLNNKIGAVESTLEEVSADLDEKITDTALTLSSELSVALVNALEPTAGYLKTYVLYQGDIELGKIDIPKDFLVKAAELKTVDTPNVPYSGAVVGDKYIDLVINVKEGTPAVDTHIYIPVKDLVDVYEGYDGPTIKVDVIDNVISAEVKAGSITSALLADESVTAAKIKKSGILTADADGALSADLSDYYTMSQTSSAQEIEDAVNSKSAVSVDN